MPWSASTSATVSGTGLHDDGGGAGAPTARRSATRWPSRPGRRAGSRRERSADRCQCRRVLAELQQGLVRRCPPWSTRRARAPLMVRVSRRPRSRAICEPSAIWVSAAGARTSWSPACSPAEDSAPSTEPARVVTWRCSPSTVMVTCFAREAAGAAADGQQADGGCCGDQDAPCGADRGPARAGGLAAVDRVAVGAVASYRPGRSSMLLRSIRRTSAVCSRRQRCRGARSRHIRWVSMVPGRGQGRPRDVRWSFCHHIGKAT